MVKKEWRVRFPKLGFQWSFRSFCIHNCFWKSGAKGLLFYFLNLRNLKSSIFYEIFSFAPPSSSSMIWWSRSHDLDFKQWNIYIYIWKILMNWESKKSGLYFGKNNCQNCNFGHASNTTLKHKSGLPPNQAKLFNYAMHVSRPFFFFLFFSFFFPSSSQLSSFHFLLPSLV